MLATLFKKTKVEDQVKLASGFARKPIPQPALIERLSLEVDATARHMKSYLPVETLGHKEADLHLATAKDTLTKEQNVRNVVNKVGTRWQIFDPSPLSWLNKITHMPTFGVFPVNDQSGESWLQSRWDIDVNKGDEVFYKGFTSNMPPSYFKQYHIIENFFAAKLRQITWRSIHERIDGYTRGSIELRIGSRFAGVIPPNVRQEIALAQDVGLKDICIVAEVPEWSFSQQISHDPTSHVVVKPSRRGDPLVLAHDGSSFWLISVFDTTSIEQLVADEFATKP